VERGILQETVDFLPLLAQIFSKPGRILLGVEWGSGKGMGGKLSVLVRVKDMGIEPLECLTRYVKTERSVQSFGQALG
jgi:hypothetical protein